MVLLSIYTCSFIRDQDRSFLIIKVQIVMIHYPLGYDVKARRVVNHHYLYPLDQNK